MCCMKAKPVGEKTGCSSSLAITLDKVLKLNQKTGASIHDFTTRGLMLHMPPAQNMMYSECTVKEI